MKILMLGWELPPHNSGGLGVACYRLCKALSNIGADIEFIIPYSGDYTVDFMKVRTAYPLVKNSKTTIFGAYDANSHIYDQTSKQWLDIFGQQQIYESAVGKIVKLMDFDVIHAHDWLTFRAGLRAKQLSGKPLILHVHSIESDRAGGEYGDPMKREIEAISMLLADKVIAVSKKTKMDIIKEYGIPANKIEVVHNSIDYSDVDLSLGDQSSYKYLVEMKKLGYRVVVSLGRMTIQKGLPGLIRAAAKVIEKSPKTIFLVVGDGDQYRELIELAAELGISKNVVFTGFLRGKPWRDAFSIGDLFVMPSISEPFGLTPLEAIGYGTPALVSKQSGVTEVLYNCLKVDYWDVDEMANQIVSVIDNEVLAKSLQDNAFREYESLSWQKSADSVMDIYNRHLEAVSV